MFETKGKVVSTRQKVVKLIRLFTNPRIETLGASSPALSPTQAPHEQVNLQGESALTAESGIAQALMCSRMLDRPR